MSVLIVIRIVMYFVKFAYFVEFCCTDLLKSSCYSLAKLLKFLHIVRFGENAKTVRFFLALPKLFFTIKIRFFVFYGCGQNWSLHRLGWLRTTLKCLFKMLTGFFKEEK